MRTRQRGFTYFAVLALVVITSVGALAAGRLWQTAERRERERELLAAGQQLRQAIASYRALAVAGRRQYPQSLDDLTLDPRLPGIRRHLRRIPVDPVTGHAEWGLIRAPDGGIRGVHSLSEAVPIKRAGFAAGEAGFADASRYADWRFEHVDPPPPAPPQGWKPAAPRQ
jgi:type II secretory pathway pseudopilin PulG